MGKEMNVRMIICAVSPESKSTITPLIKKYSQLIQETGTTSLSKDLITQIMEITKNIKSLCEQQRIMGTYIEITDTDTLDLPAHIDTFRYLAATILPKESPFLAGVKAGGYVYFFTHDQLKNYFSEKDSLVKLDISGLAKAVAESVDPDERESVDVYKLVLELYVLAIFYAIQRKGGLLIFVG
jgi:hypothetical protein